MVPEKIFLKILIKIKVKINYEYKFPIHKIYNEKFHYSRYGKNKEYKFISDQNYKLVYKIEDSKKYNNAKIIWIIDVFPLTKINLEKCFNKPAKVKLYVGELIANANSVSFWGAAGMNGFLCDIVKTESQLLLMKCDGTVTAYDLKNLNHYVEIIINAF